MVTVLPQITKLKRIALDLLFPQWCIGCGQEGSYICDACRQSLSWISPPVCIKCGKPGKEPGLCPVCDHWDSAIDGIRAPFLFEGIIRRAVHELKYHNLRALVPHMAELLYEYVNSSLLTRDVIVPVPLHGKRLRERGYNQSELLARDLGRLVQVPVDVDTLKRKSYTTPQARTNSVIERKENVAGAFFCVSKQLAGKRVILIDDVTTSGATLDDCARALRSAGVVSVWGLVIAIEP
jgi:ComF family protein